jgi:hypothetical protein
LAVGADLATSAFDTTGTAIVGIICEVDARARTSSLSDGAIENTLTVGADLAGCAFFSTSTAIIEVGFGIDANTRAISEARGTEAFAIGTDLTSGAFSGAGSAIVGIAS